MRTVRKTITLTSKQALTSKQDQWVKAQIAGGDYTNDTEYFRDLVRRDQDRSVKLAAIKEAVRDWKAASPIRALVRSGRIRGPSRRQGCRAPLPPVPPVRNVALTRLFPGHS